MGYLHEEGKTRDVFDEKSWLHSGDIGSVDKDGKREKSQMKRESEHQIMQFFIHC